MKNVYGTSLARYHRGTTPYRKFPGLSATTDEFLCTFFFFSFQNETQMITLLLAAFRFSKWYSIPMEIFETSFSQYQRNFILKM